jgi:hypothetical protein
MAAQMQSSKPGLTPEVRGSSGADCAEVGLRRPAAGSRRDKDLPPPPLRKDGRVFGGLAPGDPFGFLELARNARDVQTARMDGNPYLAPVAYSEQQATPRGTWRLAVTETLLFARADFDLAWCVYGNYWYIRDDVRRKECLRHRQAAWQPTETTASSCTRPARAVTRRPSAPSAAPALDLTIPDSFSCALDARSRAHATHQSEATQMGRGTGRGAKMSRGRSVLGRQFYRQDGFASPTLGLWLDQAQEFQQTQNGKVT